MPCVPDLRGFSSPPPPSNYDHTVDDPRNGYRYLACRSPPLHMPIYHLDHWDSYSHVYRHMLVYNDCVNCHCSPAFRRLAWTIRYGTGANCQVRFLVSLLYFFRFPFSLYKILELFGQFAIRLPRSMRTGLIPRIIIRVKGSTGAPYDM